MKIWIATTSRSRSRPIIWRVWRSSTSSRRGASWILRMIAFGIASCSLCHRSSSLGRSSSAHCSTPCSKLASYNDPRNRVLMATFETCGLAHPQHMQCQPSRRSSSWTLRRAIHRYSHRRAEVYSLVHMYSYHAPRPVIKTGKASMRIHDANVDLSYELGELSPDRGMQGVEPSPLSGFADWSRCCIWIAG